MKRIFLACILLTSCSSYYEGSDEIASGRYRHPASTRSTEESLLQAQLDACEQEIGRLDSRIFAIEGIVAETKIKKASLCQEEQDTLQMRMAALEDSIQRVQGNLDHVVDFSNEGAKKLSDAMSKIASLDSETNRDIKSLEGALRNLSTAVQDDTTRTYKVRPGDTLGQIARSNDTSVETLMDLNNLKRDDYIVVGQELVLPAA